MQRQEKTSLYHYNTRAIHVRAIVNMYIIDACWLDWSNLTKISSPPIDGKIENKI